MKPIRIYANHNTSSIGISYYLWAGGTMCHGGGGCTACIFLCEGRNTCLVIHDMDHIVKSYRPSRGYIELTLDSHPEVFI